MLCWKTLCSLYEEKVIGKRKGEGEREKEGGREGERERERERILRKFSLKYEQVAIQLTAKSEGHFSGIEFISIQDH